MVVTGSARQPLIDPRSEAPVLRRRAGKGLVDSYGDGRVCEAPGCATQLSRYNSGSACWLHDRTLMTASHWTR